MPTAKSQRVRGSIWIHPSKKRGYGRSVGSYYDKPGKDRQFNLTPVRGGKAREYSSHQAAKADGWVRE